MIELSRDQKNVLDSLIDWYLDDSKSQYISLGGYAGTGKTTLIALFRKKIDSLKKSKKKVKVAFVTFTGKAARVLDIKLKESKSIYKNDYVGTIHSLIYSPIIDNNDEIIGWEKKDKVIYDLIIIDEGSMVNGIIWNDLLSYQKPIIVVGDHGQLPPIRGSFNLMSDPILRLEQIHRQVRDNPIIRISTIARKYGYIPVNKYSDTVKKIDKEDNDSREEVEELLSSYNKDTFILCGYNSTRIKLNKFVRQSLGFQDPVVSVNDRVVCLRNNHRKNIYNGMLGTIKSLERDDKKWFYANINIDNNDYIYKGLIYADQFNNPQPINFTKKRKNILKGDLFDFGYALTVHKAQGSQTDRVILFEERFKQIDDESWQRWLYTAVTRAVKELYIIGSK